MLVIPACLIVNLKNRIMNLRMVFVGTLFCVALIGTGAMAVEEPSYKLVLTDGAFEVRDYPALVVAEVTVNGDQKEAASKGFRVLAGYIFGGSKSRKSVEMTAPVSQVPASEKIAMTAPVTQTEVGASWVVRFTMPKGYSLETLPVPDNPKVNLRTVPPARLAVLKFSGLARADDVAAKTDELQTFAAKHKLRSIGPVSLAQYDPPWTLWFMRRNEVSIPVSR
jgi:hypothetical protein